SGQIIQFLALFANTGPATLNPSSFGVIPIVKDTAAGPVPLTGAEIAAGNVQTVTYDAGGNVFHLLVPLGSTLAQNQTSFEPPINAGFTTSANGGALTITLTAASGSAPSAASPVLVNFQNANNSGPPQFVSITSPLAITIPSG